MHSGYTRFFFYQYVCSLGIHYKAKNRSATMSHFRKHKTQTATQDLSAMVYFCTLYCLLCSKQCEGAASSAYGVKTQSARKRLVSFVSFFTQHTIQILCYCASCKILAFFGRKCCKMSVNRHLWAITQSVLTQQCFLFLKLPFVFNRGTSAEHMQHMYCNQCCK